MKYIILIAGLLFATGCEFHGHGHPGGTHGSVSISAPVPTVTVYDECYDYDVTPYHEPWDCYGDCCTWEESSSMGNIAFCDVTYCYDDWCGDWYIADEECYSYQW